MININQNDLNTVLKRNYIVSIGDFIKRGWEIFQQNMGEFIGFLIFAIFINLSLDRILSFLPGFMGIPGSIFSTTLNNVIQAGYYIVAFKIISDKPRSFSDFFKAFQNKNILQISFFSLIISIINTICFAPTSIALFNALPSNNVAGEVVAEKLMSLGILFFLLLLLELILFGFINTIYIFSIPLIVERKLKFWPAMEASRKIISKNWFSCFSFLVVLQLLNFLGLMACCIGLLISIPVGACALAVAYDEIVGLSPMPPSPDA